MRVRMLTFVSMTVAALGGAMVAAPAQAKEPAQQPARHCVSNVADAGAPVSCYDSFTKAIARATGGRVTDAPGDVRKAMRDPELIARLDAPSKQRSGSVGPAGTFILSIEWEDSDFDPDSLTNTASSGCTTTTADLDWSDAFIPEDWNDEISSYRGFSNCWVKHFEHINFGGISIGFDRERAEMGLMDDQTTSIQWS
jgi:hypothetical protein